MNNGIEQPGTPQNPNSGGLRPPPDDGRMTSARSLKLMGLGDALDVKLSPEEEAEMIRIAKMYVRYASTGLWIGSLIGCAIPFRKRWGLGVGTKSTSTTTSTAVKTSYYAGGAAGQGASTASGGVPPGREKLVLFGKAAGLGLLGGMIGTQIGVVYGNSQAQKELAKNGGALKDRLKSIAQEIEQKKKDGTFKPFGGVRGVEPPTVKEGEERFESERWNDREASLEPRLEKGDVRERGSAEESPQATVSRWDELRKASAAKPSSWDKLRETSSRPTLPASDNPDPRPRDNDDDAARSGSFVSDDEAASEKEKRRREFDELLEKERQGGTERDGRWR